MGPQPEAAYKYPIGKFGEAFREEEVSAVAEDVPNLTAPSSALTREGKGMAVNAILGEEEATHSFRKGTRAGPEFRNMEATGRRHR